MARGKVAIEDLKPAEYNPRADLQPGDSGYEQIEASLTDYGVVQPLVWNKRTGRLIAGHQRLKILRAQGVTELKASETTEVRVVDVDERDEKRLNVALNRNPGAWDDPKLAAMLSEIAQQGAEGLSDLALGFSDVELAEVLRQAAETEFPVLPEGDKTGFHQMAFVLSTTQVELVTHAIKVAKTAGPFDPDENENSNGNALVRLCNEYLANHGNGEES